MIARKRCFRSHRLKIRLCLVLSPLILILQMIVLFFLFPSKVTDDMAIKISSETDRNTDETDSNYLMREFLKTTNEYEFPILIVDKEILQNFSSLDIKTTICPQLCSNRVFTFVIFHELFERNKEAYLKRLLAIEGLKFVVVNNGSSDRTLRTDDRPSNFLPLHYVIGLNKGDTFVHVVVFHHRKGKFWWHGRMTMTETLRETFVGLKGEQFDFGTHEGVYDKFSIRGIKVEGFDVYLPQDVNSFLHQEQTSRFIPCNYTRATIFRETYETNADDRELNEAKAFRETALEVLFRAKSILDAIGIPFWLSSGTCLGFFRQCDIIGHSRDVDIGIWISDYDSKIVEGFVANGFKMKHKLGKIEDSLELSFVISGIKLDIFFFYEANGYVWNGGLQTKTGNKFKYVFPTFHLCWTDFLDLKVRIPCETQSYVEANYGPDWFKPVTHWDWKSSPWNVRKNGRWPKEQWPEVIQQFDVD